MAERKVTIPTSDSGFLSVTRRLVDIRQIEKVNPSTTMSKRYNESSPRK